ncbi:protein AAR2 homolog [Topomyia yanbarensis]|uniref:protein AAR2 homolog n=1 Tax=Topomyia yanbarensis TaxID=2498891 RepID=UPI00273C5AA3|nr:protein AAR2 homolog [Topomyia yanbarensis]
MSTSKQIISESLSLTTMSPETALKLFENCAVLIIAGVPPGTEFGIDLKSFYVGEDFRGVKMIPEGVHVIYCSSRGPYGDMAPRVGFTHFFKRGEIVIREWDNNTEELRHRVHKGIIDETDNIKRNLRNLDRYLAPYDYDTLVKWSNLTANITEETVRRLSPDNGIVRNSIELLSCADADRPRGANTSLEPTSTRLTKIRSWMDEEELLPKLKAIPGTIPKFTCLPPRCPKNAPPSEISKHYIDSIAAVELLLQGCEKEIYEEIEFTFILFLCCHSIEALSHWRNILLLLSNSEKAAEKFSGFFRKYSTVLQHQLPELPLELMEQNQNNTVYLDVRRLVLNCYQAGLTSAARQLEKSINETLLWKFENLFEEDPDEMPTVVEL